MRAIFALCFFSCFANSTTCFHTEAQAEEWNKKYGSLFKVETTLNSGAYDVIAELPKSIDGQRFDSVSLFVSNLEQPTFFATLSTYEDDGVTKVWFVTDNKNSQQHYLSFSYGTGCGMSVTVEVDFE